MISIYGGKGFVGSSVMDQLGEEGVSTPRNTLEPECADVLYLISTTDNYNVLTNPYIDIDTNLTHLVKVLEACRNSGINCFNFVSSWFVYGDQEKFPVKEDAPCSPKGFYSITKKCAEDLVISYCKTHNIAYRIFRLGNVYGDDDGGVSSKKNALQFLINKMKANEDIDLYFGGYFQRDYIHVEDVARAITYCMDEAPYNDIYNIGGGESYCFIDLMNAARYALKSSSKFTTVDQPEFHKIVQTKNMLLDSTKIRDMGFTYNHNILDSLSNLRAEDYNKV